ncbi:hypothetical protein GCM10023184_01080 [Flaviaesturariibacter amylovorans]|uniref:Outer membrane protein beta-barrel domain-containing protein n=2 Tax=Flaviaesturariibacter amylovorans TaxID=1084520 RepID=A0ABP8G4S9_9BACT
MGYGGGLALDVKLPLSLGVTGSVGVLHFPGVVDGVAITAFPVRAGIKYRVSMIYAGLETGVAPMTKDMGSPVLLAPAIGVRVSMLDVKVKYETWFRKKDDDNNTMNKSNWSFFGVMAALKF